MPGGGNCSPPATETHPSISSRPRRTLSDASPPPGHFCISAVKKVGKEWRESYSSPYSHPASWPFLSSLKEYLQCGPRVQQLAHVSLGWVQCSCMMSEKGQGGMDCGLQSPENGRQPTWGCRETRIDQDNTIRIREKAFHGDPFLGKEQSTARRKLKFYYSKMEVKILMGLVSQKYQE